MPKGMSLQLEKTRSMIQQNTDVMWYSASLKSVHRLQQAKLPHIILNDKIHTINSQLFNYCLRYKLSSIATIILDENAF